MSKFARFVVLVVSLTSLFGVMSSTAGALTWTNDGGSSFHATAGPGTLSSTSVSLNCTSSTATGTIGTTPFSGATWSAATGTATFNGCVLSGVSTAVDCAYTLTASTFASGVSSGAADVSCGVFQFGSRICNITGSDSATYTNPTGAKLTLAAGGSLKTTNGTSGTCPLGNGDTASLSETTFAVDSANPPSLTGK